VDPASHLTELGQRLVELAPCLVHSHGEIGLTSRCGTLSRGLQGQGERDQALLGAVVEIPLDASTGLVLGGDDALGRRPQLSGLDGDLMQAVL
jgi:succinyl-CoA synthetase alpha subunit